MTNEPLLTPSKRWQPIAAIGVEAPDEAIHAVLDEVHRWKTCAILLELLRDDMLDLHVDNDGQVRATARHPNVSPLH